ncbi:MAG: hypothetical protein WB812_07060 [Woeseiaceae bacterium]
MGGVTRNFRAFLTRALLAWPLIAGAPAHAAPGDVLFSDNFNDTSLAPWTTTDSSRSGILTGGQTSGSRPRAAYTRNGPVSVTSPTFSAAVPAARLQIWVRRGSDAINNSEDTDAGEDFYIEYRRADNSWALLNRYLGSGTNGQIYNDSFLLPPDALHGNLAVRVRQIAGSGFDYDYWHFDDVIVTEVAPAGPLSVGTCDYFDNGLGNWSVNAFSGYAGTSSATSSTPTDSMYVNGGIVTVTSSVIDTSDPSFTDLTMWVRRGADAFSEDPDGGENLVVEYLDDFGAWVMLETFNGNGGPGQVYDRSYTLPAAGRHANFRIRFRMTGGSGATFDYWHVDDVCLGQNAVPVLLVSKIAQTLSDPINGGSNPKAIPGAVVQYTLGVSNQGAGTVDAGSMVITDPLPAGVALYVDTSGGDPIVFADGAVASGLSWSYATDVTFSNQPDGGPPYNYTPVPDAQGFDPAVTGFRINPSGPMNGTTAGNVPGFNLRVRVRIQ